MLTSDFKGLPNSLIEAMALELPCISTDFFGGGAREIIEDGTNGIIVDAGDENSLVHVTKLFYLRKKECFFDYAQNLKMQRFSQVGFALFV